MYIVYTAGEAMYELGMRIGREVPGLKGLQRQAKCYLAALNALQLVDAKYAWIIKPLVTVSDPYDLDLDEVTPTKRSHDNHELQVSMKLCLECTTFSCA